MRMALLAPIFILAACGGGGGGGGFDNNDRDVNNLTGVATYRGSFTAEADPDDRGVRVDGRRYTGGRFGGTVNAQADFDADQIDVQLSGKRKAGVVDSYNAEYNNVSIRGDEFEGNGNETFVVGNYSHRVRSEIDGRIIPTGKRISGEFETGPDRSIEIDGDFSAQRQ